MRVSWNPFLFFLALLQTSCFGQKPNIQDASSGLSDIKINVPQDKKDLFSGYSIAIRRHGASRIDASCTESISKVGSTSDLTIKTQVKAKCEYQIFLEFGKYAGGSLTDITYSNRKGGKNGHIVPARDMREGEVPLQITVYRVKGNGPDNLTTPRTTDLKIRVKFEQGGAGHQPPGSNPNPNVTPTPTGPSTPSGPPTPNSSPGGRVPPPPATTPSPHPGPQEGRRGIPRGGRTTPAPDGAGAQMHAQIEQTLKDKCVLCHQPGGEAEALRLDTYPYISVWGIPEKAIVTSMWEVTGGTIPDMPPRGSGFAPLTEQERQILGTWKQR